jgi:DNA-3-methyladenine glycosylase
VEPIENVAVMRELRKGVGRDTDIASGPGKLCMAMSIDKGLNGEDMTGRALWVEDRGITIGPITAGPRIGVDYAGDYRDKPWRFYVPGNPHVSPRKR